MNFFNCCLRREETQIDPPKQNILKSVESFAWCKMGYGPKKTECQDSYCMMDNMTHNLHFFAIYDGHGSNGKEASQATNDYIQTYLEKNYRQISEAKNDYKRQQCLREAFKFAETKLKDSGIDYNQSGTCGICVLIFNSTIFVVNLGNSAAGLLKQKGNEKQFIPLSIEHNVRNKQEKLRIREKGGQIQRKVGEDGIPNDIKRIWINEEGPGYQLTRSLGDFTYKKYLISDPEIKQYELKRNDQFVILASDGVWDVMTLYEVCEFIEKQEQKDQSAELLVQECRERWDEINRGGKLTTRAGDNPDMRNCCDDISAIIVYFKYNDEEQSLE